MRPKPLVILAFPGTGKSFLTKHHPELCNDSDSSGFSWVTNEDGVKKRNPDFPANYVHHIRKLIRSREKKYIFCSSHDVVREALTKGNIKYVLIYPSIELRELYMKRYKERSSPQAFIDLINSRWDEWITELQNDKGAKIRIELETTEFIGDIIKLT